MFGGCTEQDRVVYHDEMTTVIMTEDPPRADGLYAKI